MNAPPRTSACPPGVIVISGGDAAYADLLEDWFASLGNRRDFAVGILDVGLESGHAASLSRRGARLVRPGWDLPVSASVTGHGWFRAMTARPFLPRHFPGFAIYIWIDADAWVQQPDVIAALAHQGGSGRLAIVEEKYTPGGVVFLPRPPDKAEPGTAPSPVRLTEESVRRNLARCYALFGPAYAQHHLKPLFNSGVFALRGDSPVWMLWAGLLRQALDRGWHPLMEQQALNIAILDGRIPILGLPRLCNWNLGAELPLLDPVAGCLRGEAGGPPIGIVHLQELKWVERQAVPLQGGGQALIPLRYRALRALLGKSAARPDGC